MAGAPPETTAPRMPGAAPGGGRWRLALSLTLLAGLLAAVHLTAGWAAVLGAWQAVPPAGLAGALALAALGYGARGARVHRHFRPATAGRYGACLRLVALNVFLNNLVPMRLGEASFPWLLHRYFRIPPGSGLGALMWLRALDLHALVLFAVPLLAAPLLPPGAVLAGALAWLALPWLAFRLHGHWQPRVEGAASGRLGRGLAALGRGMPPDPATFRADLLWSLLAWGLKLAVLVWLLLSLGAPRPDAAMAGALGGELTSVLPVHGVAGAGTYEAGVLAGLAPYGMGLAEGLAAAVNAHLFLLGLSALAALAAWAGGPRSRP